VTSLDYSILCKKVEAVKKKFPNSILEYNFGEEKIFLLDVVNHPKLDPTLFLHTDIGNKTKKTSEKLVEMFHSDVLLRDFFCCNFFEMCRGFHAKKQGNVLERVDGFAKDINLFKINEIGVSSKNSKLTEEYPIDWMKYLSIGFYYQMQRLGSDGYFSKVSMCMKKAFDLIGNDYELTGHYFHAQTEEEPEAQAFFQAWQLHHFYEDYITSIFEMESKTKCIRNPVVFINPTIDVKGNLRGYVELDGCLYNSNKGPIFIECKNSSEISKKYLFKFLGEVSILEKIYDTDFNKCLVSTGTRAPIFEDLEDFTGLSSVKIFDLDSHLANYSDLREFAKTFK
jgi:hypothetical protein